MSSLISLLLQNLHVHTSRYLNLGSVVLASISAITNNWVSLFFTVAVATTATIFNIVKTVIAVRREKERKRRRITGEEEE